MPIWHLAVDACLSNASNRDPETGLDSEVFSSTSCLIEPQDLRAAASFIPRTGCHSVNCDGGRHCAWVRASGSVSSVQAVLLRVSSIADPRIRKFEDPGSAVWLSPVWIVKHTPVVLRERERERLDRSALADAQS